MILNEQAIIDRPRTIIHCKSNDDATTLLNFLDANGYVWASGDKLTHNTNFDTYGDTIYFIYKSPREVYFGRYNGDFYEDEEVCEFSDIEWGKDEPLDSNDEIVSFLEQMMI